MTPNRAEFQFVEVQRPVRVTVLATVSTSGATTAGAGAGAGAAGDAAGLAAGDAAGDAAGLAAGAGAAASTGLAVPLATHWRFATVPRPLSTETLSIQKKSVADAQAGHGPPGSGSFAAFAVLAVSSPPRSETPASRARIFFFTISSIGQTSGGRTRPAKSTLRGY